MNARETTDKQLLASTSGCNDRLTIICEYLKVSVVDTFIMAVADTIN
jgi:hypothetical protein